jgi:PKD repeat protein
MHTQGRIRSISITAVLVTAFSLFFGLTPGLAENCPCFGGVDNFCFYSPSTPGCSMTYPGGYCDPNGDGDYSDGDWVRGYYGYQDACPDGGPPLPPPPPPGDDDDDDDDEDSNVYSPWIYGIHWYGDNYAGSDVEAMTGGKKIWVLETVTIWDGWTISDQIQKFQTIVDRGHTLVIRIQPRWGWSIPAPGAERDQYLDAVEAAAQQAKNVSHIWQIGNEMNLYGEYGGGVLGAQEYIDYFKQVRQRIKNVSSPLGPQIVLVGPVSPGAYFQEVRHTDGLQYLGQMCNLLNANDFDGFALHAYGAFWEDANGARWDFQNGSGGYAAQLEVIDSYGFYDKPAFILEFNRQTPNKDAWQESQTAQFIIGAYQDLQAWNSNPNHHPIICATWFIYADVGGWEIFSLRHLRDKNPRGVDQDVWDSFQYACSLNIPAGDLGSNPPPPPPPPPPAEDFAAEHLDDTIPATMQVGQSVQLGVTLKNIGSNTWRASSNDRLGAGGENAFIWSAFANGGYSNAATDQRVFLSGADAIVTGSAKTFTFSITAPSVAGQYAFSARMVRDGVTWFGDTITKIVTVNSSGGGSLTGGEPTGAFGSGGQTDDITEPEIWRWSEWFYGFKGIDRIEWRTDGCGENHNYAMGWHQDDLIEYRMKFGGDFSRLVLRGIADRPGPVKLQIHVDGEFRATALWDNNNDCNQDVSVDIPGIVYGSHAIAIKFVNDSYDPNSGADRNFFLDGLIVVKSPDQSQNHPPSASFTATPTSGKAPLTVNFDASGSSDPDGDALIYDWDFGDGTLSSGPTGVHIYESAGAYSMSLTVSDGFGGSDTSSAGISVTSGTVVMPPYCPATLNFAEIRSQLNQQGQDLAYVKIGFHVGPGGNQSGLGDWMRCMDAAGVPFFLKSVDSAGQIWEAAQIKAASGVPHVLVYRRSAGDGWNWDVPDYNKAPYDAAVEHWQRHREEFPPELEPYKDLIWIESINEVDKNRSEWLAEFSYHTAQIAIDQGFNWAAFGWSSGEPEREHWEGPWMQQFLHLAGQHPNRIAIALHEYSYVQDNLDRFYPNLVGRFQMLYDVCDSSGIPRPKVLVTEFGWVYDDIAQSVQQAMDVDLPWAAELYAQYPNVLGASIWYLGPGFGGIANKTQPLIAPLTEYALQTYFIVP